jgi:hypothetical protein
MAANYAKVTVQVGTRKIELQIWDTASNSCPVSLSQIYYHDAQAIVIVFDITKRYTFEELTFRIDLLRQHAPDRYQILVGNRADLAERRAALAEEAEAFAAAQGMEYIEVSAKTGMGINEMSLRLVNGIVMAPLKLLWRGSRDGFRSEDFHRRCDGHANTLTLISDQNGNVFGGFTPIPWESPFWAKGRSDESGKSFLFTIKNPFNIPVTVFSQISGKSSAIRVSSSLGPCFGESDLLISDNCNTTANISGGLGRTYKNDSGVNGTFLLTGSENFIVKEIEVFEFH